jgi:hypothetical protein
MLAFLIFTVIIIPVLFIYGSNNGLEGLSNYTTARFTLGNLGFSNDACRSTYVGIKKN